MYKCKHTMLCYSAVVLFLIRHSFDFNLAFYVIMKINIINENAKKKNVTSPQEQGKNHPTNMFYPQTMCTRTTSTCVHWMKRKTEKVRSAREKNGIILAHKYPLILSRSPTLSLSLCLRIRTETVSISFVTCEKLRFYCFFACGFY